MLDDTPKFRLGAALDNASASLQGAVDRAVAIVGAPPLGAAAALLALLGPAGDAQGTLAERAGLSKQAVQQFLDQLEKAGLIRREPDPADKRAKRVFLTPAGAEALAVRQAAEREAERAIRDALGNKQFARLKKALKKLSAARVSTPE